MLLEAGVVPNSNCATRAIGYRQGLDFLLRCAADPAASSEAGVVSGRAAADGGSKNASMFALSCCACRFHSNPANSHFLPSFFVSISADSACEGYPGRLAPAVPPPDQLVP